MRYGLFIIPFIFFSCKKVATKNSNENIRSEKPTIIKNEEFISTLDSFLIKSPIRQTEPQNSILVYLYIKENDTIIDLFDQPLFECKNLIDSVTYKRRKVFFFTEKNLRKRLNELVVLSNRNSINCDELVDTSSLYVSYHSSFILQDGLIKQKLD